LYSKNLETKSIEFVFYLLYEGLVAITEKAGFPGIVEIFQAWLPGYYKEHIEE
jgi:hypothetical protein